MSYNAIARMAHDQDLINRVSGCASILQIGVDGTTHPVAWANTTAWAWAASPGWADAYLASPHDRPGVDEEAVSDAMIRDAVERLLPKPAESPA